MMGRRYFRHRRAWSPRAWPTIVPLVVAAVAVNHFLTWPDSIIRAIVLPFVFGMGGALLRWAVWRWRHPVITRDQYIEDLRRAARWN